MVKGTLVSFLRVPSVSYNFDVTKPFLSLLVMKILSLWYIVERKELDDASSDCIFLNILFVDSLLFISFIRKLCNIDLDF